jgi:hypothetical protein
MSKTTISSGELSTLRRNIARNPSDYCEFIRLLYSHHKIETGDFFADESVRYHNHLFFMQLNIPEMFRATSRNGYYMGRDFLTNQPIFKSYND